MAVIAPSVVLTVTIEATPSGASEIHVHAGGQGVWVARMVASLGVRSGLCAALGGESGGVLRSLIDAEGITLDAVTIAAASGVYIHDRRDGSRRAVAETPSGALNRHEADDLYGLALAASLEAGVVVLTGPQHAGVIGPEFYERLCSDLAVNGASVVADLSGDHLRAALAGGVGLLKISDEELVDAGFVGDTGREELIAGIARVRAAGADQVIVSRASEPAIAHTGDRLLEIGSPRVVAQDHRGAGDSMTAAAAVARAEGASVERLLRFAAAAGALNATRRGLGTGARRDIVALARLTEVRALSGRPSRG